MLHHVMKLCHNILVSHDYCGIPSPDTTLFSNSNARQIDYERNAMTCTSHASFIDCPDALYLDIRCATYILCFANQNESKKFKSVESAYQVLMDIKICTHKYIS